MRKIIELKIGKVRQRIADNYRAAFSDTHPSWSIRFWLAVMKSIREQECRPYLDADGSSRMSAAFLSRMAEGLSISSVKSPSTMMGHSAYDVN
jgi:hypothetical protein